MEIANAYAISEARTLDTDVAARLAEEVRYRGYGVAHKVLEPNEVGQMCDLLDAVYEEQCAEVGDEEVLQTIRDADVVRCPLAYEEKFLELAQHPMIIAVAKKLLGDNVVLLMQNGVINRPEQSHAQGRWHRDLNYQHWVSSKPLAIGALVCLEDFNESTGATKFLPASHKFAEFPPQELIGECETGITAPSGSIIFFDAMTFHRGGINSSARIRRAVNHVIGVPILAQVIDIPAMLGLARPQDQWLAGYLGFRWNPSRSVRDWRLEKYRDVSKKV